MAATHVPSDGRREIAPVLVQALLRAVGRAAGDEAVASMLAAHGLDESVLTSSERWFSSAEARALAADAERWCRNDNVGVRAGQELWRMLCAAPGFLDMVRSAGSAAGAIAAAATRGTRMSTGRTMQVESVHDDHVVLVAEYADPADAHHFYCGFTTGYHAQMPSAFGMVGAVAETACQADGDPTCVYRISWQPDPGLQAPDDVALRGSAERAQRQLEQLEEVHQLTSELLRAGRTDEVLARITAEAGRSVQAPRYLLAVRVSDRDRLRVHSRGFRPGSEQGFAARLLDGTVGEEHGTLVADVRDGARWFGRLAACYPRNARFTDLDRRLLTAYARHAGAVLAHVASLEEASNDRDTARALLQLARALVGAQTTADVTRRLAEVVPQVVGADNAALWLWEPDRQELALSAFVDTRGPHVVPQQQRLSAQQVPDLLSIAQTPAPVLVGADASDPVGKLLTTSKVARAAVVPIITQTGFIGVLCAGFAGDIPDEEVLLTRLTGLADHAAIATRSVQAVERLSHQATHDNLTGLANRQLFEEQSEAEIAAAVRSRSRCALLFIDLDRFKSVNDTLGHAAGDDLLLQAAHRIRGTIRPTDVLARFGGDEFLLLLPDIEDVDAATAAAGRVADVLARPFSVLGAHEVQTSASIGIACSPDHAGDYSLLVRLADAAMYTAKNSGRNGVAVYGRDTTPLQVPRPRTDAVSSSSRAPVGRT